MNAEQRTDGPRIELVNVSVRFRLALDKARTLRERFDHLVRRLRYGYRPAPFTALRELSFVACDGESIGIVGPNGGGKSTLLRTIAGIYSPDAGSVRTQGRVSALLSLGSGFDMQLTGRDNIFLNGMTIGMSAREIATQVDWIVEFAGVGKFIDAQLKYYSSGMVGRLSFAIMLAMQPDILLVDEIFSVGDLAFRQKSEDAMRAMLGKAGCRLLVSHNLRLIREQCTRCLYVKDGRITLDAAPETVIGAYQRDFGRGKGGISAYAPISL